MRQERQVQLSFILVPAPDCDSKSFWAVGGGAGLTPLRGPGDTQAQRPPQGSGSGLDRTLLACQMGVVGLVLEELGKISETMPETRSWWWCRRGWEGGKPGEGRGMGQGGRTGWGRGART